jgi:UDP-N-acetylglucosamine 2-epimerase (non-hydrolysing)
MKVLTLVGTRPEIIRLSRVLAVLNKHTQHVLVHTGQNYDYELNQIFFEQLGIQKPNHFLEAVGKSPAETIGNVISKTDLVLQQESPDAVLVLGDTNSCLGVIAAKKRKIPIFHMEAGNRSFDERVPEESNRRIVDHISDINLPYSDHAREYLLREGIPPERVIKTGSPLFEVLSFYKEKIDASEVLSNLKLRASEFFLVSCHREENVDSKQNLSKLVSLLNALASKFGKPIIVSAHPRTRDRLDRLGLPLHKEVRLLKPLGFFDYVHLQQTAIAVLSDSGSITEESSILNFPALNIRESHERPEGMEEGAVMLTGLETTRVLEALSVLKIQPRGESRALRLVADYSMPNVSEKVLRIVLSYTDYVNRCVWHKFPAGAHADPT